MVDHKQENYSEEEHLERHKLLHKCFDELLADWISHDESVGLSNRIGELVDWSHKQII